MKQNSRQYIAASKANATIEMSLFRPHSNGYAEADIIIKSLNTADASSGYEAILETIQELSRQYPDMHIDLIRYYLSDITNQAGSIGQSKSHAISIVGQTPAGQNPTHIAAYLHMSEGGTRKELPGGLHRIIHEGSKLETYISAYRSVAADSHEATLQLLGKYSDALRRYGMTLEENCIRTWFFVRDIDVNYNGVVTGRNEIFAEEGLTSDRHFIASTGIGGNTICGDEKVIMDTLAIKGLRREDIVYLKGSTHLNPTHEYGVSFERGVRVECGDRRRVIISGTASIDNKGEILWRGNVAKQTERMCENVEVLLDEGGMNSKDISHIIVYVRDIIDSIKVERMVREHYPEVPMLVVQGPVCRPGWLVEMECMAEK